MDTTLSNINLVTVLMPVYNAEKYVKQAIQSILNQNYKHFELLIINDGSIDESANIIRSFKDPRIRFLENEKNLGLIATLNKGFDLAKGKYIARMDADDVAMPKRLAVQVTYMESHPEVGVYGSAYVNLKNNETEKAIVFLKDNDSLKTILLFNSCMAHPTVMFRKEIFKINGLRYNSEFKHAEDYELWVRAIDKVQFSNSTKTLLQYRIHDKQISNTEVAAQKVVSSHIRLMMIEKLGLKPNEQELRIHNAIGNRVVLIGVDDIKQTEQWLAKLIEANAKKNFVKSNQFNSYLSLIFQDVCANASVGLKAYRMYKASPLSKYGKHGFLFKLKLRIKCLTR